MITYVQISDYIINLINNINNKKIKLSCKRLQKILYFCEVNYLKHSNGKSLVSDDFYAWESGPVISGVYYMYMQFQEGFMYPLIFSTPRAMRSSAKQFSGE